MKKTVAKVISVAAVAMLAACGPAANNNLGFNGGQPGFGPGGFGTACLSPFSNALNVGFTAPQVMLTQTQLNISGQASGGAIQQGQFQKQFYGGSLFINLQGLGQFQGQPQGPLSANGGLNVSGALVDQWRFQLFGNSWQWQGGFGGQVNPQFQQQICVQAVNMNLIVNPTLVNPQIFSGVVQLQLQTGQALPPFLI